MSDKINELTLVKAKVNQILKKDQPQKGKPALWVEFKCLHTGKIASMRFGIPFKSFDLFPMAELTTVLKGQKILSKQLEGIDANKAAVALDKFVGKEVIILVEPVDLNGKTFWTVKKVFDVKYWSMALEVAATGENNVDNSDPFGVMDSTTDSADDIPF